MSFIKNSGERKCERLNHTVCHLLSTNIHVMCIIIHITVLGYNCWLVIDATHASIHYTHTDDSDVDLIHPGNADSGIEGGVSLQPQRAGTINASSTQQSVMHFQGSVREPISPNEYSLETLNSRDKK